VYGGPRFLQIANALQATVVDGSLTPGDCLPLQRQLAAESDVDLTTIMRARDKARRRNFWGTAVLKVLVSLRRTWN
jgi:DNA-binding transcriptional regulator YhcF (GntR family)